jgi:hypothetical protein
LRQQLKHLCPSKKKKLSFLYAAKGICLAVVAFQLAMTPSAFGPLAMTSSASGRLLMTQSASGVLRGGRASVPCAQLGNPGNPRSFSLQNKTFF